MALIAQLYQPNELLIIHYWLAKYQQRTINLNNNPNLLSLITKLQHARLCPPMSGSCTTFWHNIYLQTHNNLIID